MTWSNLGNQGPDFGQPASIHFSNVGLSHDGLPLSLEITNLTSADAYDPRADGTMHKSEGRFGRIGLRAPRPFAPDLSRLELRFTFLDSATYEPVRVRGTHVSFFDFDAARGGLIRECILGRDATNTIVPSHTTLSRVSSTELGDSTPDANGFCAT